MGEGERDVTLTSPQETVVSIRCGANHLGLQAKSFGRHGGEDSRLVSELIGQRGMRYARAPSDAAHADRGDTDRLDFFDRAVDRCALEVPVVIGPRCALGHGFSL